MDADEVAEAFLNLHQSGKVRHFGVSNFTPAQFALLQSRLPFTPATNRWRSPRYTSRCCWTVRLTSCNSCAFARWPGRAREADACLMMMNSSRCATSWTPSPAS